MKKEEFESVLNYWKIYDENERWSFKSLFLQGRKEEVFTGKQFSEFLSKQLGRENSKAPPPRS